MCVPQRLTAQRAHATGTGQLHKRWRDGDQPVSRWPLPRDRTLPPTTPVQWSETTAATSATQPPRPQADTTDRHATGNGSPPFTDCRGAGSGCVAGAEEAHPIVWGRVWGRAREREAQQVTHARGSLNGLQMAGRETFRGKRLAGSPSAMPASHAAAPPAGINRYKSVSMQTLAGVGEACVCCSGKGKRSHAFPCFTRHSFTVHVCQGVFVPLSPRCLLSVIRGMFL